MSSNTIYSRNHEGPTMHVTSLPPPDPPPPRLHHCLPAPSTLPAATATRVLAFWRLTLRTRNKQYFARPPSAPKPTPPNGVDFPATSPPASYSKGELIPMTSARLRAAASSPTSTRPAYLDPSLTLTDLSTGVNFASAGAGLDDLTSESARVLTIGRQVEMLEEYKGKLRGAMGDKKAEEIVNGAVVVVSIGSNDLMNNYYVSDVRRREYSLEAYHGLMLQRMKYFVEVINFFVLKFVPLPH
ncbi:uncharacterized protein A4U43_C02F2800 [Asparagus officinalis]|uniref:Uncharacterized protein n=1 Tax=Asparagus officinalis TaxID=4686 RepID=A0A5P1FKG5_ASPOF|nr:uncharacterized protein A4U43_C02F2800 [Asparagus officinalis]